MRRLTISLALAAGPALAESPNVVTDIAPVHSLAAMVMDGVGAPELLLPPNASPHHFALRPSDAARLGAADLVIWTGEGLTPWLEDPIETLAGDAAHLELLSTEGWEHRIYGEGEHDEHDHGEHDHGEHDHGEHDHGEHDHGEHDHGDEHKHEGEHDHHGHDHHHEGLDPHAWLDPTIAAVWLDEIAEHLSEIDPAHGAQYAANAATAKAQLAALDAEIAAALDGISGEFVVPHDAYGYFTRRYALGEAFPIADQHANAPSAQHIAELQGELAAHGISCIFTDPSTNPDWAELVGEGAEVRLHPLDPIGGDFAPGADLYAALLNEMAAQFSACLSD